MQGWADPRGYTRRRKCRQCAQTFRTREHAIPEKSTKSSENPNSHKI